MSKNIRDFASPLAKKLAREHSVSIQDIPYEGKRVTSTDVQSFIEQNKKDFTSQATVDMNLGKSIDEILHGSLPSKKEIVELSVTQKVIGKRMTQSKQDIPHFYLQTSCKVDSMIRIRSNLNKKLGEMQIKISMNDMFVCAIARALARNPIVNSVFEDENRVARMPSADVAVAVAMQDGLITPIVFGAHVMSLVDISIKLKSLIKKARERKLKPEEFQGGTFTVSNLGMFDVDSFLPIINKPHAGIMSLGKSLLRPVWDDKTHSFVPGMEIHICLAADHRIVNGDQAARFIGHVKEAIECPELILL